MGCCGSPLGFAILKEVFHDIERQVVEAVAAFVTRHFDQTIPISLEQPKQASFGEIALPVAFSLAKPLRKAPKAIATEIAEKIGPLPGVQSLEVAGSGYLNVRLDRGAYFHGIVHGPAAASADVAGKVIVEHTNINPNKAAHIGHLRNAVLGDTFVRMLRATGRTVEVQNYIDNTGVQVADVVVGFHFLEKKTVADVRELIEHPQRPFDYVCWDLYARTSAYYDANPDAKAWRAETLHAIEANEGELAGLGHLVADAIVHHHLRTMLRLGIVYDVLPRESEILHLQFWAKAFELLKERQAIYFEKEGKNAGCWVMPGSAFKTVEGDEDGDDAKVIVRSNGTVTYVGKDIAYQLWKFGLLGRDFHYRHWWTYPDGHELWASTATAQENEKTFGRASEVYNVIDSRQSYLQDVVVAGLRALGFHDQAERSVHFSYEMVALTPRTCAEMGIQLSEEDQKRAYVEVSGRKGLGVKADDLIDQLIANAAREVDSRNGGAAPAARRLVAEQIAIAALRYFMLKFTRPTVIAFDFQEALSFVGETGPYVQYAAVRAAKIVKKIAEAGIEARAVSPDSAAQALADEELWQLLLLLSKADSAIAKAATAGEPAYVAKYAFQLAQAFSGFYERYRVLDEADAERQQFLLWMTGYFRRQLERVLDVLGIPVPEFM
jgi:arginyl-tRNA synthetase